MERNKLVNFLCYLNSVGYKGNHHYDEHLISRFEEICGKLSCNLDGIMSSLHSISKSYSSPKLTPEWKYILLNFYMLKLFNEELEASADILSVQQRKSVKDCIRNLVTVGIASKLHPQLPFHMKISDSDQHEDFLVVYNILKCTTLGLCESLKIPNLRLLILPDSLKEILVATYQLAFCPLKKPSTDGPITAELYAQFLEDRKIFENILEQLNSNIHPLIYLKVTMVIFQANSPSWFKKSVSQTLTNALRANYGVENIATVLLDGVSDDSGQTWKIFEVFTRLIQSCKQFPDFKDNICKQLLGFLEKVTDHTLVFERIFVHCTKSFYQTDEELARDVFIRPIMSYFLYFTYSHTFSDNEDITDKMKQHVRILQSLLTESNPQCPNLPLSMLRPVLQVLFRLYCLTSDTSLELTRNELKQLLTTYLETYKDEINTIFDSFLFNIHSNDILAFRNDVALKADEGKVVVSSSDHAVLYSVSENCECTLKLLKNKQDLTVRLFVYLLSCLSDEGKYFKKANEELLNFESEVMNEFFEAKLTVYKILSELSEDKDIQKKITGNPGYVVGFVSTVIKNTLELLTREKAQTDSEAYQILFTVLIILQNLVMNSSKEEIEHYKILKADLEKICAATDDRETNNIIREILGGMIPGKGKQKITVEEKKEKTELDKALEDIYDPILPTRGHGLMTLAKLLEKKDKDALERKQFLLNLFQQNLKNEDSYIYLSAIGGLAALADVFPDTVLNVLCEEYSDTSKKYNDDGHEVRMKLGETLVRVTKILGDMAPKYKPLLLNTFLAGAKDDDDLVRTSSLSNLGEICRVLGYKLGTIITEVLVCVHAIISTDKSPQARRAAVTVLRQLFIGLDTGMIEFLKEEILPIYRTLKAIYSDDKDDVMRLQAQLALEELNENVKNFVFPNPQLSDRKVVVLKSLKKDSDDWE
ncbi:unnamed protein product [Acanthoscelides obtectus]|uniref:Transport and Golgi organization protein 6 homolog n=2 Tax=Acanthoscelides obtectus TaxID=200917 RepID=A0A9P0L1Q8_ACAOB|nr:unnamed protein product [Acanthoscelides obtectus]CAK1653135.1 Transport and Golgi organization protein 6 homolog [Acanthoscelides obtectus]